MPALLNFAHVRALSTDNTPSCLLHPLKANHVLRPNVHADSLRETSPGPKLILILDGTQDIAMSQ